MFKNIEFLKMAVYKAPRKEAATGGVLSKKVFLEILYNSQGNTCARVSFFNKVAGLELFFNKVAGLRPGAGVFL